MIVGIGIDILEINRLEAALARPYGERLRQRLFTKQEITYCEKVARQGERFATRFAAKEAVRKAFGVAIRVGSLSWQEVEILSAADGSPKLKFSGHAAELIARLQISRTHVSLSHSDNHAIAFVVLERD